MEERGIKTGKNGIILFAFMVIMIGLGISDSSRGVFSGIFERDLSLTKPQVSMIVTVSYIGNLLFVLLGGKAADRYDRKKVFLWVLAMWTGAQLLFACTGNYGCLLLGMFFGMGASTFLNTMMNLLAPVFFGSMAGMYINILFFVQGIGTSGNQKITGSLANGYADFKHLCLGLALIGALCFVTILTRRFPKGDAGLCETGEDARKTGVLSYKKVFLMGIIFGCYFVAEHGIMNWWSMYCQQGLRMTSARASTGVSLFFGTMTVGRLLFSPLVQKMGSRKSILILGGMGCVVYILGILAGGSGIWILGISGIFISIIYPTMVLFLQDVFSKDCAATAVGMVISFGTVFDIAFNAAFGNLVELMGFGICKLIFPIAMIMFYAGFVLSGKTEKNRA